MKITILIRVYDRVEDLKYNLEIIKDTWKAFTYYIIVVSNGISDGYLIPEICKKNIDELIILDHNWGHIKGSAQLLKEGLKFLSKDSAYTIILEADTWIYTDSIVSNYINKMERVDGVWASADWYDKNYSYAVDFAIIRTSFLMENPQIFDLELYPECYIANYLKKKNQKVLSIQENMPVHIPSYLRRYPCIDDIKNKRFYVFPKSKMITHHVEYLKGGMNDKKIMFNIISKVNYFKDVDHKNKKWILFKINFWIKLVMFLPKKTWIRKKGYMIFNKNTNVYN